MVRTFSKEQLRTFIKENNLVTAQDTQAAVKALFGQLIQEMLEAELEHELGYSRYDYRNKKTESLSTALGAMASNPCTTTNAIERLNRETRRQERVW